MQDSVLLPGFSLLLGLLRRAFLCPNEKLPRFIFLQQICVLELKMCVYYVNNSFRCVTSSQICRFVAALCLFALTRIWAKNVPRVHTRKMTQKVKLPRLTDAIHRS